MLVNADGKPILSEVAAEQGKTEGAKHWDAMLEWLKERNVSGDRLADLIANLFIKWCAEENAGTYQSKCMNLMTFLATQADHWTVAKAAEMKIRQNALAANPGHSTKQ